MHEDTKIMTLEDIKESCCILPFAHPDYVPPTPHQVTAVVEYSGLSQRNVARLTGVKYTDKGSTIVRKWKTKESHKEHRPIPYAAWRLLLEYCGIASTEEARKLITVKAHDKK